MFERVVCENSADGAEYAGSRALRVLMMHGGCPRAWSEACGQPAWT
ncbi:MAG: hypothetical protein HY899_01515 [Deltaproteobacteria bacterium]|nr:hypothetical protein [Deltaproteobacteria bacterium]